MWLLTLQLFKNSTDTQGKLKLNLHSLSMSVSELLENTGVSLVPYYVTTHPPAIQKQHWHSREAQIEPPLFECECMWVKF
jgi:predicted nuclease with RNAse H fold